VIQCNKVDVLTVAGSSLFSTPFVARDRSIVTGPRTIRPVPPRARTEMPRCRPAEAIAVSALPGSSGPLIDTRTDMLTIFVGDLPPEARAADVRELFVPYGTVHSLRLNADIATGECGGFVVIEMEDDAARAAMAALNGTIFMNRTIKLDPQLPRDRTYLAVGDTTPAPEPDARPATDTAAPDLATAPVFVVDSVEKTEVPGGARGDNWYRYVLKSERSTITGLRSGSREQVRTYASQAAERLNIRSALCQNSWSPRGRKPAPRGN
jgi:RNA recognition motif. (a.k.a. RRM, RBD, or RNP domain)